MHLHLICCVYLDMDKNMIQMPFLLSYNLYTDLCTTHNVLIYECWHGRFPNPTSVSVYKIIRFPIPFAFINDIRIELAGWAISTLLEEHRPVHWYYTIGKISPMAHHLDNNGSQTYHKKLDSWMVLLLVVGMQMPIPAFPFNLKSFFTSSDASDTKRF
jgi:hypothetical protein